MKMGRATRWFKGLFGIKTKDKEYKANSSSDFKDTKGSSFGREDATLLCHNPATIPPNISPSEAAWLRSYYNETEEEQNKHAIAVAAATAAAADAAVAAANAAVAVVRLTSHGRGTMFGGGRERWAAVKVQTVFRGYLVCFSFAHCATKVHIFMIFVQECLCHVQSFKLSQTNISLGLFSFLFGFGKRRPEKHLEL